MAQRSQISPTLIFPNGSIFICSFSASAKARLVMLESATLFAPFPMSGRVIFYIIAGILSYCKENPRIPALFRQKFGQLGRSVEKPDDFFFCLMDNRQKIW
jgi:hypothetical protein